MGVSVCMFVHACPFSVERLPDIDFCVTLLLCMLRSALQVVIPLILSGFAVTNDLCCY